MNIARVAGFLALQLLLLAVLLELGLRLLERFDPNIRPLLYNPYILGRYEETRSLRELMEMQIAGFHPHQKRGGFVLNSKSFQTREYTEAKPSGTTRIVLIGDSFTAGAGTVPHAQHWGVLLEQQLRERMQTDAIEVIKLGVEGAGPRFELRLWELEGSKLDADWVVLQFFVGNDFLDEQYLRTVGTEQIVVRSYLVRLFRNLMRLRGVAEPAETLEGSGGYAAQDARFSDRPTFRRDAFLNLEQNRMSILDRNRRAWFAQLFADLQPVLSLFDESVRTSGARPLFLLIPDQFQVDSALVQAVADRQGRGADDYDLDLPQREMVAWFERNRMSYLDLLPVFRKAGEAGPLYKTQDTHWNVEGNRLASEELGRYLAEQLSASMRVSSGANGHDR